MNNESAQRRLSLDVIRSLAIFLVITIHTFTFDVTKNVPMLRAAILCVAKIAVPLFLLLTGYLNNRKTVEDYYERGKWKGCFRVLLAYIVLGGICYIESVMSNGFSGISDVAKSVLSFKLTPYGWYVEMWIGLFFLTPFLNVIVHHLTPKTECALLVTLLLLSSVPLFLNRNGNIILPGFWMQLWPVAVYFLGAWLSRNEVKVRGWQLIVVILGVAFGEPLLNRIVQSGSYLYFWGGHNDIVYTILAFIVFAWLLKNTPERWLKKHRILSGGVILISKQSLNMYLVSACFDSIFHLLFAEQMQISSITVLPWLLFVLVLSFSCSLAVSIVYDWVVSLNASKVTQYFRR